MVDISLSAASRSNLLSLNRTTDLISRTQERLSTGKKVNSAIDDALSFFKSRNLETRASDLVNIKSGIIEGINTIETAVKALEEVEKVLQQMKATAQSVISEKTTEGFATAYATLESQLGDLIDDASYGGINLLNTSASDALKVVLNEKTSGASDYAKLEVAGTHLSTVMTLQAAITTGDATTAINTIDVALTKVRSLASNLGSNAALLNIRKDFTENMINTLEGGAASLVNADVNTESANMLSLQTRQQLGTISLSIAQQSEQAVLRLF